MTDCQYLKEAADRLQNAQECLIGATHAVDQTYWKAAVAYWQARIGYEVGHVSHKQLNAAAQAESDAYEASLKG